DLLRHAVSMLLTSRRDADFLDQHVLRHLIGKKDGVGDVIRGNSAAYPDLVGAVAGERVLVGYMIEHFRLDHAGRDHDHTHVVRREMGAKAVRHAMDVIFGATIDSVVWIDLAAGNRAHIDDGAALARDHARHDRVDAVHDAVDVDVDGFIPFGRILPGDVGKSRDAGIVEQAVGRTVFFLALGDGVGNRLAVANIDLPADRVRQVERLHAI